MLTEAVAGRKILSQFRLYCGSSGVPSFCHMPSAVLLAVSVMEISCGPARKARNRRAPARGCFSGSSTIMDPANAASRFRPSRRMRAGTMPMKPRTSPSWGGEDFGGNALLLPDMGEKALLEMGNEIRRRVARAAKCLLEETRNRQQIRLLQIPNRASAFLRGRHGSAHSVPIKIRDDSCMPAVNQMKRGPRGASPNT